MNDLIQKKHYSRHLGRLALILGVGSVVIALVGAIGAGQDLWPKMTGLGTWQVAAVLALVAIILSLLVLVLYRKRGGNLVKQCVIALVFAGAFAGYIGYIMSVGRSVPAIHDVTTDVQNPPLFAKLEPRGDNLSNIPGRGDPAYSGKDARERWALLHMQAYSDIKPIMLNMTVADAVALAEKVAQQSDWVVAVADGADGRMEATDSVSLFEFKDDVVVRVTPVAGNAIPDSEATPADIADSVTTVKMDVRSVSRLGVSDLGVNAKRIREFLKNVRAAAPQ